MMNELLHNPVVREALKQAWHDSEPGFAGGHEEGGFLCLATDGTIMVDRWQRGEKSEIQVPPHLDGKRNGEIILATFHTHPNTGNSFDQEPSPGDCQSVEQDPDLKHREYVGEFVISKDSVFVIRPSAAIVNIGPTPEVLFKEEHND